MALRRLVFAAALVSASLSSLAHASPELDRLYALKTVGFLKSVDNVDGLFTDYVASAYRDYFSRQSRFILQDLSQADSILSQSKIPYKKLVNDPQILAQVARAERSEAIIRTHVTKEGSKYNFLIELLHSPKMELLSSETFSLDDPGEGHSLSPADVEKAIEDALDKAIRKLPWVAQVTGRDHDQITVDVGMNANLKKGDSLVLATLEQVKLHPLLHAIVDWRFNKIGEATVETAEDRLAFCRITEQEPDRQVARYQKVVQVISAPANIAPEIATEQSEQAKKLAEPPRLGWVAGGPWIGGFSREYSSSGGTVGKAGGGFFMGAKAEGQLWLTREFFVEAGLGYGGSGYSQHDIASGQPTQATGASGTLSQLRLDAGYTYYISGNFFGPKAWVKLGYLSDSFQLPIDTSESTSPTSFKSLFVGLGADLPIRDQFGAYLNLDFGLINSTDETGLKSGDSKGPTQVQFFVGGYYRLTPRLNLRAGIDVLGVGTDYSNAASLTQKVIAFSPGLLFYF